MKKKSHRHNRDPVSITSPPQWIDEPFPPIILKGLLIVIACIIITAVYWPTLSAKALSFDDSQYLLENHLVQNPGWSSARRFLVEVLKPSTVSGYYQPLSMISLMLDYGMGGRVDELGQFHRTSLFLHLANTALVIILLYQLFGRIEIAVIVGLLFGLHPMTVESVSCISERKTLLASFFALLCMIAYVRYAGSRNWKLYILCIVTAILALMSKPTTVPLPILLILLDFWPLRRLTKKSLVEKVPLFIIAIVFAVITVISQKRTAEVMMPGANSPVRILLITCHNIIFYLDKMFCPVNLSPCYLFPAPFTYSNPAVLRGILGVCVLIPMLLISLRWTRALLTSWLFFFAALFPTIGVIGFTFVIASDKYVYLPSVGILILLAYLLVLFWERICVKSAYRIAVVVIILFLAVCESAAARGCLAYWKDTDKLIENMLATAPDSVEVHNFAGCFFAKQGRNKEATAHFLEALRIRPDYYRMHNNLGIVLAKQGDIDGAIEHFSKAVERSPAKANAHFNLAQALYSKGDVGQAIKHYRESLRINYADPHTQSGLSWILATSARPQFRNGPEAVSLAKYACELTNYKNPETLDVLAAACAENGEFKEAVKTAQKAIDLYLSRGAENAAQSVAGRQKLYMEEKPYRANK